MDMSLHICIYTYVCDWHIIAKVDFILWYAILNIILAAKSLVVLLDDINNAGVATNKLITNN